MTKNVIMKMLRHHIEKFREREGLTMNELAGMSGIDQSLISKYESGRRLPSDKHLKRLASVMGVPYVELRKDLLADKIHELLACELNPFEILEIAETRLEYLKSKSARNQVLISDHLRAKLSTLDNLKERWMASRPLDSTQVHKMSEYFAVKYTYDSNRIEGNTLTLQETHLVVNEGLTIGGKTMREHLEAVNHYEAIDWMSQLATEKVDIDKRVILDLHRLILKTIDSDNAGKYRSVPVRISGSDHIPPEPFLVEKLMEDFFFFYQAHKSILHPVVLAAEMHERLVRIHPFIDGNGRTSRLLMNLILLSHGYTIVNLKGDVASRMTYYQALEAVHAQNEPEHFHHLIVDHAIISMQEHLDMT